MQSMHWSWREAPRERGVLLRALLGLALMVSGAGAHAQSSCFGNFTSPLVIPITGELNDVLIDDLCETVYATNGTTNTVEVISLQTLGLRAPIAVGSQPAGLDASPDGRTLYVANSGASNISVVDLATGKESLRPEFDGGFSADRALSVATARNGLVLFSTTFFGSGFGARMMQYDPTSRSITPRNDFWFSGSTTEITRLRASGDRSAIGIVAGDISSGPVFKYLSDSNTFTPESDLNSFVSSIALDQTGKVALVNPGTFVLSQNLVLNGTIAGGALGVAVSPDGKIGYSVSNAGQVDVLELTTLTKVRSIPLGDTVNRGSNLGFGGGVGAMRISRDGSILAVITDNGIALLQTGVSKVTQFAAMSGRISLNLQARGRGTFFIDGIFTLGGKGNGIDLRSEPVRIQIGALTLSLPAGSFQDRGNSWTFGGTVSGVTLRAVIRPTGAGRYQFVFTGSRASFTGSTLPLGLSLLIGDDGGGTTLDSGDGHFQSR